MQNHKPVKKIVAFPTVQLGEITKHTHDANPIQINTRTRPYREHVPFPIHSSANHQARSIDESEQHTDAKTKAQSHDVRVNTSEYQQRELRRIEVTRLAAT